MANAANYFKVCSSALGLAKLHENQNRKILKPSLCPSILSTLEWLIKVFKFFGQAIWGGGRAAIFWQQRTQMFGRWSIKVFQFILGKHISQRSA